MRRTAALLSLLVLCALPLEAQPRTEYRAFWVDTFNTTLNNHADVLAVVNNAKLAKANALFAQVRRRGDAWYLNSLEPLPDFVPIAAGFDPLQDLINEAHANGIEVHAFVIIGAIWNKNPTFAPTATLGPPTNLNHVFNLHGWDPVAKVMRTGPQNWLTKSTIPDGTAGTGIAFQGQRFGNDFWLDLGHPDAAKYSVDVLVHLASNYAIDGIHLDRIRYPEFTIAGQTPSAGTNIGYNETSVARFNRRFGRTAGTLPAQSDNDWKQWRRDQVTSFVRRLYIDVAAVKPQMKMSGSFIAFGGGPTTDAQWPTVSEAYWRVYQDWRAWTEEGIIDIAMPMAYKREHTPTEKTQFDQWNLWLAGHQYNRMGVIGVGGLVNSIEGVLPQVRRGLASGNKGVSIYSMATSNLNVTANPLSIPPGQNTPIRSFAELASGLTTGKSINGLTSYENTTTNPVAIFAEAALIPPMPWKGATSAGHLRGLALRGDGSAVDTGDVTISRVTNDQLVSPPVRVTKTDGNGYFGAVDLPNGRYHVKVQLGTEVLQACYADVIGASVVTSNASFDTVLPQISATPDLVLEAGEGCKATAVVVKPAATDNCPGVQLSWTRDGVSNASLTFELGKGQESTIIWTATDASNRVATQTQKVKVVDTTAPALSDVVADTAELWPVNSKMVKVDLAYSVSDACAATTNVTITSNEDQGDEADFEVVNNHSVRLRAERDGNGDGRIYTITVTATDADGNSVSKSTTVVVAHDQRN